MVNTSEFDTKTFLEDQSLYRLYTEILQKWKKCKGKDGVVEQLGENFSLVHWMNQVRYPNGPESYFEFLSCFGCIRLNVWCRNYKTNTLVVNADMYVKGIDKSVRGKGEQSLEQLHRILQLMANESGYTIYDIAIPNKASERLLTEEKGYKEFTTDQEDEIFLKLAPYNRNRYEELMRLVLYSKSKVKKYNPSDIGLSPSPQEQREIDMVLFVSNTKIK